MKNKYFLIFIVKIRNAMIPITYYAIVSKNTRLSVN